MRQLERTVGLKDLTVAEMEGRLREMSATTFDGVFVWRISDFAKKRQDAIAGRAPAMFSPGTNTRSVIPVGSGFMKENMLISSIFLYIYNS